MDALEKSSNVQFPSGIWTLLKNPHFHQTLNFEKNPTFSLIGTKPYKFKISLSAFTTQGSKLIIHLNSWSLQCQSLQKKDQRASESGQTFDLMSMSKWQHFLQAPKGSKKKKKKDCIQAFSMIY